MRRATRFQIGAGLTVLALGAAGVALWQAGTRPSLIDRARRIGPTAAWRAGTHFNEGIEPAWLSDTELLVCRFDQQPTGDPPRQNGKCTIYPHNIVTVGSAAIQAAPMRAGRPRSQLPSGAAERRASIWLTRKPLRATGVPASGEE